MIKDLEPDKGGVMQASNQGICTFKVTLECVFKNIVAEQLFVPKEAGEKFSKIYFAIVKNATDFALKGRDPKYIDCAQNRLEDEDWQIDCCLQSLSDKDNYYIQVNFDHKQIPMSSKQINNQFTHKEWELLALLANGIDQNEIAEELKITTNTLKTHIRNLKRKTSCKSFFELAQYGRKISREKDLKE